MLVLILLVIFLFCTFFIIYSYCIYPVLLSLFARFFKKKTVFDNGYQPTIGVVVPVYNEEKVIKRKIENILSMSYPADKISIWVGSDQSTDKTNDILKSYDDERIHLWIAPKRGGKTEVLNKLVPQVDAEIIFLTDANTMHKANCLQKMVGYYADPAVGAVLGRVRHIIKEGNDFAENIYRTFEVWQKNLESSLHSAIAAFGGFYTIRKEYFKPIPFNAYSNDDVLIPMNIIRRKKRVIFENDAVSEEDATGYLRTEFYRRIRIGAGNFQAFFWLLDFLIPFRGWSSFCYISHKVFRWFSPFAIIGSYVSLGLLSVSSNLLIFKILLVLALIVLLLFSTYKLFKLKIIRPLYYFFAMNIALFFGFFRYLGGIKSAAWSRTKRS